MKTGMKHVIEIAGGLILGGLMSDGLNKLVDISKKVVEQVKEKKSN